jgi:hypothetical protein
VTLATTANGRFSNNWMLVNLDTLMVHFLPFLLPGESHGVPNLIEQLRATLRVDQNYGGPMQLLFHCRSLLHCVAVQFPYSSEQISVVRCLSGAVLQSTKVHVGEGVRSYRCEWMTPNTSGEGGKRN